MTGTHAGVWTPQVILLLFKYFGVRGISGTALSNAVVIAETIEKRRINPESCTAYTYRSHIWATDNFRT